MYLPCFLAAQWPDSVYARVRVFLKQERGRLVAKFRGGREGKMSASERDVGADWKVDRWRPVGAADMNKKSVNVSRHVIPVTVILL